MVQPGGGADAGGKITDPIYQAVLVQTALTRPQQEAVAHILEVSPPPSDVFQQLRAELIRIHGKSEWKRMGELFALPPLGGQRPGELLMQMKRLRPSKRTSGSGGSFSPASRPGCSASWRRTPGRWSLSLIHI